MAPLVRQLKSDQSHIEIDWRFSFSLLIEIEILNTQAKSILKVFKGQKRIEYPRVWTFDSSKILKNFLLPIPPIYRHLIFDIIEFEISSLMSWIFAGYAGSKNPIQTRKKIQFIKMEI